MSESLIVCFFIIIVVSYFTMINPLFLHKLEKYIDQSSSELDLKLESLLGIIAELEVDHSMGKLTTADYEQLSLQFKTEYLNLKKTRISGVV